MYHWSGLGPLCEDCIEARTPKKLTCEHCGIERDRKVRRRHFYAFIFVSEWITAVYDNSFLGDGGMMCPRSLHATA